MVWSHCRLTPWLVWVSPRLILIPSKLSWVWCLPSSVTKTKMQHIRIIVRALSALLIQANWSFSFSWLKLKPWCRNTDYCDDIKPSLYSLHKYFAKYQAVQEVYGIVSEMLYGPNPSWLTTYMCHLEVMTWHSSLKDQPWLLNSKFCLWAERKHTLPID